MLPIGIILLWAGAIVDIPSGFVLCDGNNATPDLRDRFVIGAGSTFNPDDTGGNSTHTHIYTGDGHTHEIPAGAELAAGDQYYSVTNSTAETGTTNNGSSLPPYYTLAYIMKT